METLAERTRAEFHAPEIFSVDEIGWVGADADVQAVLLGTTTGPLADAHVRIASLGRIAAHPRLVRAVEARLGGKAAIAQSAYWRSWDGTQPVLAGGDGQVALVFLGWRGRVSGTPAALGGVVLVDADEAAGLAAEGATPVGPFLVVRYAAEGAAIPALADDCLWPSAWCV
jgi:hypothetical protein